MKSWTGTLAERWNALQPRERLGLQVAGLVGGLYLLWALAMAPALQTLSQASARQQTLEAQLHRVQALAAQAAQLRSEARTPPQRWRDELRQAVQTLGAAELQETPGGLQVVLKGSTPEAVGRWLVELGPRWRLQVGQASLRRDEQGLWHGQLMLRSP